MHIYTHGENRREETKGERERERQREREREREEKRGKEGRYEQQRIDGDIKPWREMRERIRESVGGGNVVRMGERGERRESDRERRESDREGKESDRERREGDRERRKSDRARGKRVIESGDREEREERETE